VAGTNVPELGVLPASVVDANWQLKARVHTFDAANIYEEINGEAEKFIKQGLRNMHYATLRASDGTEFAIELYDQGGIGGVRIAEQPHYLLYHDCYDGKTDRARELFGAILAATRSISHEQATRAAAVCPQGIDIASHSSRGQHKLCREPHGQHYCNGSRLESIRALTTRLSKKP